MVLVYFVFPFCQVYSVRLGKGATGPPSCRETLPGSGRSTTRWSWFISSPHLARYTPSGSRRYGHRILRLAGETLPRSGRSSRFGRRFPPSAKKLVIPTSSYFILCFTSVIPPSCQITPLLTQVGSFCPIYSLFYIGGSSVLSDNTSSDSGRFLLSDLWQPLPVVWLIVPLPVV